MVSLATEMAVNFQEVSLNMLKQSLKLLWLACQPFPVCNSKTFPSTLQYESHTSNTDWPAWTGFQSIHDDTNHARWSVKIRDISATDVIIAVYCQTLQYIILHSEAQTYQMLNFDSSEGWKHF